MGPVSKEWPSRSRFWGYKGTALSYLKPVHMPALLSPLWMSPDRCHMRTAWVRGCHWLPSLFSCPGTLWIQRDNAWGVTETCSADTAPGWAVPAPCKSEQRSLFKPALRTGSPRAAACREVHGTASFLRVLACLVLFSICLVVSPLEWSQFGCKEMEFFPVTETRYESDTKFWAWRAWAWNTLSSVSGQFNLTSQKPVWIYTSICNCLIIMLPWLHLNPAINV